MTSGTPAEGAVLSKNSTAMLFLRLYSLLQQRQETSPDRERHDLIEQLRPLRAKLIHDVSLDESEWTQVGSSITELVNYLHLVESSSLGTPQAQTNRLLSTPAEIDAVLQRSPTEPIKPSQPQAGRKSIDAVIPQAVANDQQAVARVLEHIRPLVVRYCRARVGRAMRSTAYADVVAQEVCLAVLTALPSYRDQGRPFMAFVYGIAAHKVADAHRAIARNRSEPIFEPDMSETAAAPEQRAMQSDLSRRMKQVLAVLPDKQREIVVLRTVVGLSAEETAEAVGSTPGAVRVAQHRALARIRKMLAADEEVV